MRARRHTMKKGQLTVEYVAIFIVFVAVAIYASTHFIKPTFNGFYNGVGNIIDGATGQMQMETSTSGGGGTGGGETGGGGTGGGGGDTGGGGGGTGGGGGDTGGGGGGTGGGETGGGGTGGGGGEGGGETTPVTGSTLDQALESLKSSSVGGEYYTLIESCGISIVYEDMEGLNAYWDSSNNKIVLNADMEETSSSSYIASVIAHEATHADYTYNSQKWIDSTLDRHPELGLDDLHISVYPYYSLDQEYMACCEGVALWNEVKGTEADAYWDAWAALVDSGEDVTKAFLHTLSPYSTLPDY